MAVEQMHGLEEAASLHVLQHCIRDGMPKIYRPAIIRIETQLIRRRSINDGAGAQERWSAELPNCHRAQETVLSALQ